MRKPRILVLEALSGSSRCVREAGGIAATVSPLALEKVFAEIDSEKCDGLLLTGGGDVDPRRYGVKGTRINKNVYGVDETRDAVEFYALGIARERNWPVLGICRGHQIQNVEAGGTLHQDIGNVHYGQHLVIGHRDSMLRKLFGARDHYVTSLHHQEVKDLGAGYRVSGMAPDGTVEAIESIDGRCIGVQFHPEMDSQTSYSRRLFRWLVEESANRAGLIIDPLPKRTLKPRQSYGGKVVTSYFCPTCGMRFDRKEDQVDHKWYFHGIPEGRSSASLPSPYSTTPLGQLALVPTQKALPLKSKGGKGRFV